MTLSSFAGTFFVLTYICGLLHWMGVIDGWDTTIVLAFALAVLLWLMIPDEPTL